MREKRCRCGLIMRRQFDDLFNCVCGTSWLASEGFFMRTKDMTFETVVEKVGNQVKERHIIHRNPGMNTNNTELPTVKTPTQRKAPSIPGTEEVRRLPIAPAPSGDIVRGGIYYIKDNVTQGAEIHSGRPAVVVSDVKSAYFGNTVTVVYLTSREKTINPTRVRIHSCGDRSIALCETIDTIDAEKVGAFIAMTTPGEMIELKRAMAAHLGIRLSTVKD